MDTKVKSDWLEALRSGNFEQGAGALKEMRYVKAQHCCLGVLCEIAGLEQEKPDDSPYFCFYDIEVTGDTIGDEAYLPKRFRESVGIVPEEALKVARMNDDGKSFEEIADYIEENF